MNTPATRAPQSDDDLRALLSALADGDAASAHQGCELWRDDPGARETWHVYHLIGDVMRSEELATTPARDAAFLSSLRDKLAAEPVVLAPAPVAVPVRSARARQRWLVPAAAAAGFVAVAGVLVVVRMQDPQAGGPQLAMVPAATPAGPGLRLANTQAQPPATLVIDGRLIRDARLDAYLQAHRQAGFVDAAVPGAAPRSFEALRVPTTPVQAPIAR